MLGKNLKIKLIDPKKAIKIQVAFAWRDSLQDMSYWLKNDLVDALIFGGKFGITGITQTPFFQFISSPEGLGQLGIEPIEIRNLLIAYQNSFDIQISNNKIVFKFGDIAKLIAGTPHPASGTGNLTIKSWMQWIVQKYNVRGYGYVKKSDLPRGLHRRIRVKSVPSGLMIRRGNFGSSGSWKVPDQYRNYAQDWFASNVNAIEKAIIDQIIVFLNMRLS